MGVVDDLIAQFQAQQDRANLANEKRYAQGLEIYDRIVAQYEPGGAFGQGIESQLQREKTKTVASQTQQLVSSGLFGTSVTAGLGQKFEEEVGAPTRLRAQDISFERLAQAGIGKAGFIERREDTGPDFSQIAQLASSIGAGQQAGTGGRSGGTSSGGTTGRRIPLVPFSTGGTLNRSRGTSGSRDFSSAEGRALTQSKTAGATAGGQDQWEWKTGISGAYSGQGKELTDSGWTYMGDKQWRRKKSSGGSAPFSPQKGSVSATSLMEQADPFKISGRF